MSEPIEGATGELAREAARLRAEVAALCAALRAVRDALEPLGFSAAPRDPQAAALLAAWRAATRGLDGGGDAA